MGRRFLPGPDNPQSGPRLPQGPKAEPVTVLCFRCHGPDAIRFELRRYAYRGSVLLCGNCVREANAPLDPPDVTPAA